MDDEPVTIDSVAGLAMANTELLGQAASIIGAQNCILRALLRDLVSTDPGLLDRLAVLAQPDLEAAAPGVAESFTAILARVGEEEADVGH
jgi:hypothetical protein